MNPTSPPSLRIPGAGVSEIFDIEYNGGCLQIEKRTIDLTWFYLSTLYDVYGLEASLTCLFIEGRRVQLGVIGHAEERSSNFLAQIAQIVLMCKKHVL